MRAGDLLRQLDQRLLPRLAAMLRRLDQGPARNSLLSWVAVLSCGAVLFTAVFATGGPPLSDRTVGEVTRVGIADGDSIPSYERTAAADLAGLARRTPLADGTYALVSLSEYVTPQSLATVVGDVGVSVVFGRVPLPDRQTEIVRIPAQRLPEDVTAGMADLAERKEREAADYRSRAAALGGGGPQERELRQLYVSGARLAEREAAAYRESCACVYAVVVRAKPSVLRGVATRPGVRVVDPAPEVRRLERTVFTPPLPEQRDVARPPVDRELLSSPTPNPKYPLPSWTPVPEEAPVTPEVTDSSPSPTPSRTPPVYAPPSATPTSTDSFREGETDLQVVDGPEPTP
ncbi:hypothetical protein ACGFIK_07905 [Micromonospora sp. NPDC048871]|uniref:hypothetical protein n=1 Tax=unclassified Micromonospora TaxID=2617518 RepID=UPI002E1593BC|nr:hypothetical protein OIE53_02130 [Micromonospora sp. NBC_01739]